MNIVVSEIQKEEAYLEKKSLKAAKAIFESNFGKEAAGRVEELVRRFNPGSPSLSRRKLTIRTEEDSKRVIAWAVGQRIRMERERQGLRQEDLAEKAGIQRPNIARIEKGKHIPSVSTLQKVARALNLETGALMAVPTSSEEDMHASTELAEAGMREWGKALEEEDSRK